MFEFSMESSPAEKRRAALMALINSAPKGLLPPQEDVNIMVDLILHAVDETVNHTMDHFKRADASFRDRSSLAMMITLTLHLLELQFDRLAKDLLATAEENLRAKGGEAAVEAAKEEARNAVFGKRH